MINVIVGVLFGRKAEQRWDERAAERRWRQRNAEKRAAGCQCGAPATEVRYDYRNVGSVPVEFWTCAEHVGVASWSRHGTDGPWVAYWPQSQPCADCPGTCPTVSKIDASAPYQWHCPKKGAAVRAA